MNYENAFNELVKLVEHLNRAYKLCNGVMEDRHFDRLRGKLNAAVHFGVALGIDIHVTYHLEPSRKLYIHSISMPGYLKTFY